MSKKVKKQNIYVRLLSYMGPYKGRMILAILLILLGVLAQALAPMLLGQAINHLGSILTGKGVSNTGTLFIEYLIGMVVCYAVFSIFTYVSSIIVVSVSQNVVYDLRKQIDRKLQRLPLNYYDTTTYGDILSRLTSDVEIVSDSFQATISQIISAVFTVIFTFIMMIGISGWLTFVGLITVPFVIIISNKITAKSEKEFAIQMKKNGELNGVVEEYYSGHNVVSVFGKEEDVIDKFEETNDELFRSSNRGTFLAGVLYPVTQSMNNIGYVFVSLVGALTAIAGGLSIGMIQAFAQYLSQFSTPVTTVMQIVGIIQQTGAAGNRIFEFIDEEEEVEDTPNPKFPKELKGEVVFDHVKFGYLPHQTLIHDLNITIKPGSKTAIVGPTGAGKTTLVNLIMRFYDVKGGGIRVDGVDVRDMRRQDLRNIFGMVLQDTWLYSGTIMENIRYGKLDATDEEVIAAAKNARADGFIRTLPGGYNFVLQEGAGNIAQGQRQLITIARAMLNNPPILILDEATSSVDTRTEVLIQEAMVNIMKGKTSFVIAHRLSTIKDSEVILYMQDGDILEVGNHESLMAKNGLYAKLYNSQFADNNG